MKKGHVYDRSGHKVGEIRVYEDRIEQGMVAVAGSSIGGIAFLFIFVAGFFGIVLYQGYKAVFPDYRPSDSQFMTFRNRSEQWIESIYSSLRCNCNRLDNQVVSKTVYRQQLESFNGAWHHGIRTYVSEFSMYVRNDCASSAYCYDQKIAWDKHIYYADDPGYLTAQIEVDMILGFSAPSARKCNGMAGSWEFDFFSPPPQHDDGSISSLYFNVDGNSPDRATLDLSLMYSKDCDSPV